ncbi:MAG: hypothetical protein ACRCU1_16260 [Alsobacter sp.]
MANQPAKVPAQPPTQDEIRRKRSVVLGLVLAAIAVLFFVVTLAKLGGNVLNRPL